MSGNPGGSRASPHEARGLAGLSPQKRAVPADAWASVQSVYAHSRLPGRVFSPVPTGTARSPAEVGTTSGVPALRRLRFGAGRAVRSRGRGSPGRCRCRCRSGLSGAGPGPVPARRGSGAACPLAARGGTAGARRARGQPGRAAGPGRAGLTGPGAAQRRDGGAYGPRTGRTGLQPSGARLSAPALRHGGSGARGEALGSRVPTAHRVLFFSTHSRTPQLAPLRSPGLPRSPAVHRKSPVAFGEPGHQAVGTEDSCLASAPARRPAALPRAASLPVVRGGSHNRALPKLALQARSSDRAPDGGARRPVLPRLRASPPAAAPGAAPGPGRFGSVALAERPRPRRSRRTTVTDPARAPPSEGWMRTSH